METNKIKMDESQIREIIQKIIGESLNELSPNYYSANAQKAQNALNGFGGKMMKTFNPNKYNKIQNQAQRFQSYSDDHPDDTYDITSYGWADPMHIHDGYEIRNNRTGNVKGFNDADNTIPIRGSVTSNGEYGRKAPYLNRMKKMNESQFREIVSKVIRESLEEIDFQNPNWSDDYFNSLTDVDGYEDEDTFGDELETIRGAIEAIKGKLAGGNLANADEQSTAFVQSKISEMENILNELMSDDWY